MRVLVVEDSPRLQRTLGTALRKSGYAVDVAADGEEGLWLAKENTYDVIVLDVMLPKRDGLSLLGELRRLGTGADDYLVKPFALEELLARVQALCRRAYGTKQPQIAIADLEVDPVARRVRRGERAIELTAREFLLLEYLARRRGHIVSRSEIEEHIYDGEVDPMSNVVDSAICSLRKKIGAPDEAPLIHTRRGLGYVLEAAG